MTPKTIPWRRLAGMLVIAVLTLFTRCDLYSDDYYITPPSSLRVVVNFPGLVSFDVQQSAETTTSIPSTEAEWRVFISKLNSSVNGRFTFLVNAYKTKPFVAENLEWTKLITLPGGVAVQGTLIKLGRLEKVLTSDMLEVVVLDNGLSDDTDEFGGYYSGEYVLSLEGVDVKAGTLNGIIDHAGKINLELSGLDEIKFIDGQGLGTASSLSVFSTLTDEEGRDLMNFNSELTGSDGSLNGSADIVDQQYDNLEITIKKKGL